MVASVAVLAGCVGDDTNTATFPASESTERVLPQVTTTTTTTDDPDVAPSSVPTTTPLAPLQGLEAELVADGFNEAVFVTGAPGTEALFVIEQPGVIQVVSDGQQTEVPFLDITDRVGSSADEQGLLGLAFHPTYASTGRFFAYWTDRSGGSVLAEFNAPEPTIADRDTMKILLEVGQPARNHNGGMIAFGPDEYLYVGLGDGGGRAENRSQDTTSLLGSILKLDVSAPGTYTVPDDNPFGNEIWAYGLRNPWRFSIDPLTRLMYIGDVGQDRLEEIDVLGLNRGAGQAVNFGWPVKEADACFASHERCGEDGFTDPILQYPHPEGCSVTGGWVYRGTAIPEFFGHYFYADFCSGLVRSFAYTTEAGVTQQFDWTEDLVGPEQVSSFGVDNAGELFILNWTGELFKIVPRR